MTRPLTATDEDILQAARRVLARRGPDAFSMAEVAKDVGLSRAAIILRFTSTDALKARLLTKLVDEFDELLRQLPKQVGGDGLLHVAAFIGLWAGTREGSARFFTKFTTDAQKRAPKAQSRALMKLEVRRGESLSNAIAAVMPTLPISHESAVEAFRAHLSGSLMTWLGQGNGSAREHLVLRTREWLKVAGVAYSEELVAELSTPVPPLKKGREVPTSTATRRGKTARVRR